MTDLERARWLLPEGTDEVEVRELAEVIAAARREGAEQASGEIHALRKALHEETMKRIASAEEMRELREALGESVRLQSHYAAQLNDYDGGKRMRFNSDTWLSRLRELREKHDAAAIRALPLTPEEPT